MIGLPNATGDGWGQPQEVLGIPSIEGFGVGLQRTIAEQGIIDRAAGKIERCGVLDDLEVLVVIKGDERQISRISLRKRSAVSPPTRRFPAISVRVVYTSARL